MSRSARRLRRVRVRGPWRACGSKHRYTTEHEADRGRRVMESIRGRALDLYACPWCRGWHLTHQR